VTVRRLVVALGLATLLAAAPTSRAEEAKPEAAKPADTKPADTYTIGGSATAGYRFVDVDGSTAKYREDYNLHEGPVLFGLDVDGVSHQPDKTPVDRFHLEVDTPGNEPASFFRLSAADRERYDLRVDFTRSKYFYAVPQLWEQPVAGDVRLDDLHDFNTTRTNGLVDLTVRSKDLPTLHLGYRLYERTGDATSTIRIPGGDTFVVNAPLDTVTNVGRIGTDFHALGTDFFLQQEYRRVSRDFDQQGGATPSSPGVDPTDASTLAAWTSHESEHLDIPATTVRLRHPIGDAVDLTGAYFYSHADLGFHGDRFRNGTSNDPAFSGIETANDHGGGSLDTHVVDLGTTWRARDWLRFHGAYRFDERSQNGNLTEPGTFGLLAARTGYQLRVHAVTGDVEVDPRTDLSLRAGARWARRDANFSQTGEKTATDTVGAIGGLEYRPCTFADFHLRYEGAQVDDPLTIAGDPDGAPPIPAREITLTFVNRGTAGLRLRPRDWATVSYELTADSRENGTFNARSQGFGNTVALSVQPLATLTLYAGYTRRDFDNQANIFLAPLYNQTRSLQRGNEDVFTSTVDWDFKVLGESWSTGCNVAYVDAHNTLAPHFEPGLAGVSFFDLDRVDGGAFLTWHHRWIEPTVEFRMIDYNERVLPQNDYRATIVALKLRKAFSFGF
jgi:hypothetical protein